MTDEVLKLALDALEGFIHYLPLKDEAQCNRYNKAITALRLTIDIQNMAFKATYKEQLETKDEPVAWEQFHEHPLPKYNEKGELDTRLRVDPVTGDVGIGTPKLEKKDEPVAWEQFHEHMAGPNYVAPQRTWVGLTDDEREQVINANTATGLWHMAKDIEAKLKEKNT